MECQRASRFVGCLVGYVAGGEERDVAGGVAVYVESHVDGYVELGTWLWMWRVMFLVMWIAMWLVMWRVGVCRVTQYKSID